MKRSKGSFMPLLLALSFFQCSDTTVQKETEPVSVVVERVKKNSYPECIPVWYKKANGEEGIITMEKGKVVFTVLKDSLK